MVNINQRNARLCAKGMTHRIFISSVQKEFAEERRLLKRYISKNPAYRRFFDTFVFEEDVVAADRRTDEVYLEELGKCDIYIGLIGREYGFEDAEGVSPTEREFDEATRLGLTRLLFVLDNDGDKRHPKETAFLKKISTSLIRAKCSDPAQLLLEIYASLDGMLVERGAYRMGPFDASPCDGATMADIDEDKVRWFVKRARQERNASILENISTPDLFTQFQLFADGNGSLSNAAVLLFGKMPQRFHISSEVKCVHWHGTERRKPILSYQIYKGNLFEMADSALEFVLARIDRSVGTRSEGNEAPREFELPRPVVAEAIVNAIVHRDYGSTGSVQVELFADKLLIMNPGCLNPALRPDDLFKRHASYPNNPRIAEPFFFAKYIEKLGSGITDLIDACRAAGLGDPEFDISAGTFNIVIHRRNGTNSIKLPEGSLKGSLKSSLKSSLKILEILAADSHCTYDVLAERLGISRRAVTKQISNLRKEGKLRRIGPDKGGHWEVVASR